MKNVVIIGANSAVAKELIRRYAAENAKLFLMARNEKGLSALVDQYTAHVAGTFAFDFNDTDLATKAVDAAFECLKRVDEVLIAHGYLGDQMLSERDFQEAYEQIHSNFINVVALLIPLMDKLKTQNHGKVAVLLSVAGDRGRPRNFTYGSAKGALALYLQGLRSVFYHSNVEIYSFKLGPIISPMTVDHEKNFSFSTVETIANGILKGLKSRRYVHYVPGYWFFVMAVVKLLPEALFQKLKFLSDR